MNGTLNLSFPECHRNHCDHRNMYPIILSFQQVGISTYFLILSFVSCFILYFGWRQAEKQCLNLFTFVGGVLLSMVFGFWTARLWYFALVFPFSPQALILKEQGYAMRFHWTYFFHFWQGGFVLYGGFFGALGATTLFLIWRKESLGLWADFVAPLVSLGHALGRWACFFAGCCYGKASSLPWALPRSVQDSIHRHPTALYAFVWEVVLFVLLKYMEKKREAAQWRNFLKPRGNLFLIWLFLHGLGRLWIESLRADMRGPFFYGFSLLAWVSLFLLSGAGLTLFLRTSTLKKKAKKICP